MSGRVYVVDTCALTMARKVILAQSSTRDKERVWARLAKLASDGQIYFPVQVYKELEQGNASLPAHIKRDWAFEWVQGVRSTCVAHSDGDLLDYVLQILAVCPKLLDAEDATDKDPADPFVLAMALQLLDDGYEPLVVTEDIRDRAKKASLRSACGTLGVPTIGMWMLLSSTGCHKW